jgi:hypothetical protein
MGKYLHVIQDYFAHSAMVLMGSEHTPDMDDPNSNWLKSMEMAQLTLDLLRSFKERRERVLEAACQACRVIPHMPI